MDEKPSMAQAWGYATIMVFVVSCCSLIGVSIMPLISGPSYKIFNSLFTGLAVGSLVGSAIFSLIPQSFGLHLKKDKAYLYKSLMIFFGIYLFYFSERLLRMYFDRKEELNQERDNALQLKKNKSNSDINDQDNGKKDEDADCGDRVEKIQDASTSSCLPSAPADHGHQHHHYALNAQEIVTQALKNDPDRPKRQPLRRSMIAPVAWMIIIGDGIHNFVDGLAIGSSYTESLELGFNVAIAVIFEELPHELGDFAVLIASGMTFRQAATFNFLSACTCFVGMVFGILLGDMAKSASYILALAGGMFLYISLVDMMGELSAMLDECKKSTKEVTRMLLMQNIGILSGIIIIYALSYYSSV